MRKLEISLIALLFIAAGCSEKIPAPEQSISETNTAPEQIAAETNATPEVSTADTNEVQTAEAEPVLKQVTGVGFDFTVPEHVIFEAEGAISVCRFMWKTGDASGIFVFEMEPEIKKDLLPKITDGRDAVYHKLIEDKPELEMVFGGREPFKAGVFTGSISSYNRNPDSEEGALYIRSFMVEDGRHIWTGLLTSPVESDIKMICDILASAEFIYLKKQQQQEIKLPPLPPGIELPGQPAEEKPEPKPEPKATEEAQAKPADPTA